MSKPTFNAKSIKHKEDHWILPEEIIIDETLNGRFEPHSEEDVKIRAIDLLTNGQLQPVGIRKAHDQKERPQLVYGFLRTKAALFINEVVVPKGGIEVNGKFIERTKPFMLHAMSVGEVNDSESLKKNILENLSRKGTTVMDMVSNQKRLLDQNESNYAEVAELYGMSETNIRKNQKLLSLPREAQLLIHRGLLTADAGHQLLEVKADEKKRIIKEAKALAESNEVTIADSSEQTALVHMPGDEAEHPEFTDAEKAKTEGKPVNKPKKVKAAKPVNKKKIISKMVKQAVKNTKTDSGEAISISLIQMMAYFDDCSVDPALPEQVRYVYKKLIAFRLGEISDKAMTKAMVKLGTFNEQNDAAFDPADEAPKKIAHKKVKADPPADEAELEDNEEPVSEELEEVEA